MKVRSFIGSIFLVCSSSIVLQGCAVTTSNLAKLNMNVGSGKAALAIKYSGEAAGYPWVTSISLLQYLPERAREHPNKPPGYGAIYQLKHKSDANGYSVISVDPGLYYISHATIQTNWAGCFNRNTIVAMVLPDTVTYLGEINLDQFYLEVSQKIKADGQEKIRFDINKSNKPVVMKSDLAYAPDFKPVRESDLTALSEYLISEGANVSVPVISPKIKNISFPKGIDGCSSVWL